jgi:signal transduction histidine kinase
MDSFMDFLKLDILLAQPQTFIGLLFIFSFLDPQPPKLLKRLAIFTFIHSVYTDALILIIPFSLHVINSIAASLILIFILFPDLSKKQKLYLILFWFLLGICLDIISSVFIVYIEGISMHADLIRDDLFQMIKIIYPQLLIILITSWFIRKRNLFSAKRMFSIVIQGDRSSLTNVIGFIIVQFFLLGILQMIQITPDKNNQLLNSILIYVTIFVSFLALVSILRLLIRTREQAVRMTQEVYVEDINNMFTSIRGQRHDFLNHVQVIHTMVQMGRTDQLKAYVADLVKETHQVSEIVQHSSPALAAFIQAKLTVALGKGIAFTYELPNLWNIQDTSIKIIDIVKIMGNLVDNAFDESERLPQGERQVHASVALENDTIQLTVSNHGRVLDAKEKERIFLPGYSTKGENHSGLGLAIVLERVKHYNGKLELQSAEDTGNTIFHISLPHPGAVSSL